MTQTKQIPDEPSFEARMARSRVMAELRQRARQKKHQCPPIQLDGQGEISLVWLGLFLVAMWSLGAAVGMNFGKPPTREPWSIQCTANQSVLECADKLGETSAALKNVTARADHHWTELVACSADMFVVQRELRDIKSELEYVKFDSANHWDALVKCNSRATSAELVAGFAEQNKIELERLRVENERLSEELKHANVNLAARNKDVLERGATMSRMKSVIEMLQATVNEGSVDGNRLHELEYRTTNQAETIGRLQSSVSALQTANSALQTTVDK